MGFWQNVENECSYRGLTRKELATAAHIAYTAIGSGLDRNSMPSADTALRISKVLGVSIEYLLSGNGEKDPESDTDELQEVILRKAEYARIQKYRTITSDLEKIPEHTRNPIIEMIRRIAEQVYNSN